MRGFLTPPTEWHCTDKFEISANASSTLLDLLTLRLAWQTLLKAN